MGKQVDPNVFRLGVIRDWDSKWFATGKAFSQNLISDIKVRGFLEEKLKRASVSKIKIERLARNVWVVVHTARPGVVIGRKGEEIERLRGQVSDLMGGLPVQLSINEIRKPDLDARLVAEAISEQIVRRVMFKRTMKRAVNNAMRAGAIGVKVRVSGRLGGAEIARTEWYREGQIPLHTLRADIDYGVAEAQTTYGVIGIKVWIYKGEVFPENEQQEEEAKVASS